MLVHLLALAGFVVAALVFAGPAEPPAGEAPPQGGEE
jgi:hypothetical protein